MLTVLRRLEEGVLALLLTAMIALAAWQVLARNLFDGGILWGDSLVKVLVLWVTLIGAMAAARRGEHIRIDLIPRLLGPSGQRLAAAFGSLFTAAVCGLFAYHAYRFVLDEYEFGGTAFAAVPAWLCAAIIPFGFAVMALRYTVQVFRQP